MPGPHIDLSIYANEEQLLAGLRRHEPDACTCLVKRFAPLVYARALHLLGDPDEAEGALQATFVSACAKLDSYEGRSGLGTWLYRIVTNEALMQLRRTRPQVSLDEVAEALGPEDVPYQLQPWPADPAALALDHELAGQLERALLALPEGLRVVFVLRELQGLSTDETAAALGLGESAVKVRLHRARLRLRELLAGYLSAAEGA
ncbi:MAG TPA: sigma-70 family RNA polymerase sigma factor [Roseiflexaceae bacterium]|nr:sigma-70 family RNA polymerase sigma factor [Roseiflexaceae bacterium]